MNKNTNNVQALADRFTAFNQQLINFVEACPASDWQKVTKAEGWSVGVTAHHVGSIHYPVYNWVQMIVEGMPTPTLTMADVDAMNLQHAQENADCTQEETAELLRLEGDKAVAYLMTLDDAGLDREAYLKVLDTNITAGQLFAGILIDQSEEHLVSMQETVKS